MKKSILLLALITLFSCSTDSEPTSISKQTIATKNTEMRVMVISYDTATTISDTGYKPHGIGEFYSNNTNDCGKKIAGSETDQIGMLNGVKVQTTTSYRYNITCN